MLIPAFVLFCWLLQIHGFSARRVLHQAACQWPVSPLSPSPRESLVPSRICRWGAAATEGSRRGSGRTVRCRAQGPVARSFQWGAIFSCSAYCASQAACLSGRVYNCTARKTASACQEVRSPPVNQMKWMSVKFRDESPGLLSAAMKPPSRRRALPQRFLLKHPERRLRDRSDWCGWSRAERRRLKIELKKQSSKTDYDVSAIKERLPNRSVIEITSFLQYLKSRVGKMVAYHVRHQLREERTSRVPVQLWEKLAQDMAGSLEGAISSAFSQMLVIGATEPCSLLHSLPPCSELSPGLCTVPQKSTPTSVSLKVQKVASTHTSGSTALLSEVPSAPLQPSNVKPLTAAPSVLSLQPAVSPGLKTPTNGESCLSSTTQHQTSLPPTSQSPLSTQEFTVNFENIYRFLNAVSKKAKGPTLSAMESGVVLDLLLSLPEELPLLDCQELQHHMWQVHTQLTATVEESHPHGVRGCDLASPSVVHGPPSEKEPPAGDSSTKEKLGQVTQSHSLRTSLPKSVGDGAACRLWKGDAGHSLENSLTQASQNEEGMEGFIQNAPFTASTANRSQGQQGDSLANNGSMTVQIQSEPSRNSPTLSKSPVTDEANWATVGFCPLNPFMIPLKLLARCEPPVKGDGS